MEDKISEVKGISGKDKSKIEEFYENLNISASNSSQNSNIQNNQQDNQKTQAIEQSNPKESVSISPQAQAINKLEELSKDASIKNYLEKANIDLNNLQNDLNKKPSETVEKLKAVLESIKNGEHLNESKPDSTGLNKEQKVASEQLQVDNLEKSRRDMGLT